jgi:hypothetical protein
LAVAAVLHGLVLDEMVVLAAALVVDLRQTLAVPQRQDKATTVADLLLIFLMALVVVAPEEQAVHRAQQQLVPLVQDVR